VPDGRLLRSLALAAWLLAGAWVPVQAATVFSLLGTLHILGAITPDDVPKVAEEADALKTPFKVFLGVTGGDVQATLDVADQLSRRTRAVVVSGPCVYACAGILLPALSGRDLHSSTVIAFAALDVDGIEFLRERVDPLAVPHPQVRDTYSPAVFEGLALQQRALHARLRALEDAAGIDASQMAQVRRHTRWRVKSSWTLLSEVASDMTLEPATTCRWWVPDQAALERLGLRFTRPYRRPDPKTLAERLGVPTEALLLDLSQGEAQCRERPTGSAPAAPAASSPPAP
jgi:hypothetical protein